MARPAIHAFLTEARRDTWKLFAEANGVSMSGLLGALADQIAADVDKAMADGGDATDVRQDWIKQARKIDALNRRRGGQS